MPDSSLNVFFMVQPGFSGSSMLQKQLLFQTGGSSAAILALAAAAVVLIGVVMFLIGRRMTDQRTRDLRERVLSLEAEIDAHERIEREIIDRNTHLEQAMGELQSQLDATNKELEAFAYSVSHDLRSPLRSMLAYSEILLAEHSDTINSEGRLYQQRVRANAERLDGYIAGILTYFSLSRQELVRESVDLSALARQVIDEILQGRDGLDIAFSVAELPPVFADRALMRVVLSNLIGNAVKFTDVAAMPEVSVGFKEEYGRTVYFVKDNGIGLDMKFADTIFETFQRLHGVDQYPGRGIGLALVRRIILRHGGSIWVQSEDGKGATFFFTVGNQE